MNIWTRSEAGSPRSGGEKSVGFDVDSDGFKLEFVEESFSDFERVEVKGKEKSDVMFFVKKNMTVAIPFGLFSGTHGECERHASVKIHEVPSGKYLHIQ